MEIPKAWIEAGARALAHNDGVADMDFAYTEMAKLCLAAIFGKADVVYTVREGDRTLGGALGTSQMTVRKGDTLVIVRGAEKSGKCERCGCEVEKGDWICAPCFPYFDGDGYRVDERSGEGN